MTPSSTSLRATNYELPAQTRWAERIRIADPSRSTIHMLRKGLYHILYLYVDGSQVAHDAEPLNSLEDTYGDLYFVIGSNLEAGTFFSGLIDDIRIYNRVVTP